GGDHGDRTGVDDAFLKRLSREAAEHDRMGGADSRARLHRDHTFDRHRDIDDDAVALLDAARLEAVGELAHAVIEVLIGDLCHLAVIGLEHDRGLVGVAVLQVAVETVVRSVELAVFEPLVERRVGLVERFGERLVPHKLVAGELGPEPRKVRRSGGVEPVELGLADIGLGYERRRGWEYAAFVCNGLDLGHALLPPRGNVPAAKDAIAQILTNSRLCAEGHRPVCQDTGIVVVFVRIGMNVRWADATMSVTEMVNEGVRRAYLDPDNKLRASILADPAGKRTN